MNLNYELQDKLDSPIKSFEVALRCYISSTLLNTYTSESALKNEIQNRADNIKDTKAIFSGKFSAEAKSLLGTKEWSSFWNNIAFAKECYEKQEHIENHDVAFVSQILLMSYIFQDLFQPLILQFNSPSNYMSLSQKYYDVRNALSHRASTIITDIDANGSVKFIETASGLISSDYFWFCSKSEIKEMIAEFYLYLNNNNLSVDNLSLAPFPNNKIVCREPEISELFKYVCGWDGGKSLRNRKHIICISGYGGIGKTSLVLEFISQLLDKMKQNKYLGMRPSFILFYSAKDQMLDINDTTGIIQKKRIKSQFNDLESLKSLIFSDLEIVEFDDYWKSDGIIIIDNLETLNTDDRHNVMDYLYEELPSTVQAIITTRVPENDVDYSLPVKGFRNEAGVNFIKRYAEQNGFETNLSDEQMSTLVKYSFGNSLVLVLSLKRLASKKTSYHTIITEMKNLPSDNTESIITQFMFQNTINEILKIYSSQSDGIRSVLICLSLSSVPLSVETLMAAHRGTNLLVSEIEDILQLLTEYLVTDKVNDCYSINEFAARFILINMHPSTEDRKKWENKLISAQNENKDKRQKINNFKKNNSQLRKVLEDWNTEDEEDALSICYAFDLYTQKYKITSKNVAFEIDQLRLEVERIQQNYGAHPYLFYQYARILNELKQEGLIDDEYKELTIENYEKCIMMIDDAAFKAIKSTKTYPSILWIYSIYLYTISQYEKASNYSLLSIKKYKELNVNAEGYYDAIAIYCLSEIELYKLTQNNQHRLNAINYRRNIPKRNYLSSTFSEHLKRLDQELTKHKPRSS